MWQESGRIERSIAAMAQSPLAAPDVELIFVDDGSTDRTAEVCEEALATHALSGSVIRLAANAGKGAAVRAGVLAARGAVVGFSDADLSCPPRDIVAVFNAVEPGVAPVAIASRTDRDTVIAEMQPWARRTSGALFNAELRLLGLTGLRDTQCGLKAFAADAAQTLFEPLRTSRFAFDVEVLARASRLGMVITEVPVEWRHVEASRVEPFRDGLQMVWDALRIRWWIR
jgi:dolichyl-phosphate beta-glucosyltransferase